jgi:hypothetical protein
VAERAVTYTDFRFEAHTEKEISFIEIRVGDKEFCIDIVDGALVARGELPMSVAAREFFELLRANANCTEYLDDLARRVDRVKVFGSDMSKHG